MIGVDATFPDTGLFAALQAVALQRVNYLGYLPQKTRFHHLRQNDIAVWRKRACFTKEMPLDLIGWEPCE
jgi:hypothetical protein